MLTEKGLTQYQQGEISKRPDGRSIDYESIVRKTLDRENTIKAYISGLRLAVRVMAREAGMVDPEALSVNDYKWETMTMSGLTRLRVLMKKKVDAGSMSVTSANMAMSAIKYLCHHLFSMSLMTGEVYRDIKEVKGFPKAPPKPKSGLIEKKLVNRQIQSIRRGDPLTEKRDRALICFLYATGGRASDAQYAKVGDVDPKEMTISFISRKTTTPISVAVPDFLMDPIQEWLEVRGERGQFLFNPINYRFSGAFIETDKMISSRQTLYNIWKNSAEAVGITTSPHSSRVTIGTMIAEQVSPKEAQETLGHKDIKTTMGYVRRAKGPITATEEIWNE